MPTRLMNTGQIPEKPTGSAAEPAAQRVGGADHPVLGGGRTGQVRDGRLAGQRGDVDDVAPAALEHAGESDPRVRSISRQAG